MVGFVVKEYDLLKNIKAHICKYPILIVLVFKESCFYLMTGMLLPMINIQITRNFYNYLSAKYRNYQVKPGLIF